MAKGKQYLSGQKFGKWTVVDPTKHGRPSKILARCSCGTEKLVNLYTLTSGKSTNCGCQNIGESAPNWKGINGIPSTLLYRKFSRAAEKAPVELSYTDAVNIYHSQSGCCLLTNEPLNLNDASLERISVDKPYTTSNACWVNSSLRGMTSTSGVYGALTTSNAISGNTQIKNTLESLGFTKQGE